MFTYGMAVRARVHVVIVYVHGCVWPWCVRVYVVAVCTGVCVRVIMCARVSFTVVPTGILYRCSGAQVVVVLATVLGRYTTVIHVYRSLCICGGGRIVHSCQGAAVLLSVHRGCMLVGPTSARIISVMIIVFIIIAIINCYC